MSDSMKERGQSLESEYFHRKERELIEKMREKMAAEAATEAATEAVAVSAIKCPKCEGGTWVEVDFESITIDICDKCGGAWLDPGELETLTKKENQGWFSKLLG